MARQRIIVALRDTEHIDSLVNLACELANSRRADLIAIHVVEETHKSRSKKDDEKAADPGSNEVLAQASRIAHDDFRREMDLYLGHGGHPGETIVNQAKERGAQLIILGYRHRYGWGEAVFGSTLQYVADTAPCRVVVQVLPRNNNPLQEKK